MKDLNEKLAEKIAALTPEELKIYTAIMKSFPKTNPFSALDKAYEGGVNFQFVPK